MPNLKGFPSWTRGRAQRHLERGCSPRCVGLILGRKGRRAADAVALDPVAPHRDAPRSNVLPFRRPAPRPEPVSAPSADLRQA